MPVEKSVDIFRYLCILVRNCLFKSDVKDCSESCRNIRGKYYSTTDTGVTFRNVHINLDFALLEIASFESAKKRFHLHL